MRIPSLPGSRHRTNPVDTCTCSEIGSPNNGEAFPLSGSGEPLIEANDLQCRRSAFRSHERRTQLESVTRPQVVDSQKPASCLPNSVHWLDEMPGTDQCVEPVKGVCGSAREEQPLPFEPRHR